MLSKSEVKNLSINELKEQRSELHKVLLEADRSSDDGLHDEAYKDLDMVNQELRLQEQRLEDEREQALQLDNKRRGGDVAETAILRPDQSLRAYMQANGLIKDRQFDDLRLGQIVRAMITGPRSDIEKRALAEGTDSTGGYTVPTITLARFFDALRAATVSIRAGAQTVPLTTDKTVVAKLATDAQAAWRLENSDVAIDDPTFAAVTFTARSLAVIVKASRELLEDSLNVEQMLELSFIRSMAVELDKAMLLDGSAPIPTGIVGTSGVGSVDAAGALTSYDKILDTIYECWVENSPTISAMIMHPRTMIALAKLKESTTDGPLEMPRFVRDIPMMQTTSIPINLDPVANKSLLVLGDFSKLLLGLRTSLRIEILRELYAEKHQYAFVAHLRADVQLAHAQAFAFLHGIA